MKEDFLHYVWKYQLFDISKIKTIQKETISIIKPGSHNQDSGPDFLNAKIQIENQLWVGNVEIHLKSSDWYAHNHEKDQNYDAVILHVVWEHDVDVYMKNNLPIPTIEVKNFINKDLLHRYYALNQSKIKWIPCEKQIGRIDEFLVKNWLERLYFERLESKSLVINQLLRENNRDWERVLFLLLAKSFGLNKNGDAFLQMAKSIPFSIVRKENANELSFSALLFGQAGFLNDHYEENYVQELKKEYRCLQKKYSLEPIENNLFQFFRIRPSNFPTIRLAQLSSLYKKHRSLFSKMMKVSDVASFYQLFEIEIASFWKTHYTFLKESKKSTKMLTKTFIDLLIINTIIPLKFCYEQSLGNFDEEMILKLIRGVQSEKNNIISKFSEFNIRALNAMDTQALLELKNNYCAKKQCLQCAIGNQILKK